MKTLQRLMTTAAAMGLFAGSAYAGVPNLLVDGGFEGTLTADGPPFVGFWEGFSSDGTFTNPESAFTTAMPRTGQQALELEIDDVANGFAGAFQDVPVGGGLTATLDGWHKAIVGTGGGVELRFEFRNSVSNTEISRTPNMSFTGLGSDYESFSLSEVVPAGANTVRVVYAIQSFGGELNQQIFVDDLTFVPEPASFALLGLGGLAMLRRRG